ncbi:hypothetical protein ACQSSU_03225 [Micromonospora echinospora]
MSHLPTTVDAERVARHRKLLIEHGADVPSAFVVGFITPCLKAALDAHPGDRQLVDALAMIEAWRANNAATVEAYYATRDAR